MRSSSTTALVMSGLIALPVYAGDWVSFTNETTLRLPTTGGLNDPALSTSDPEEKDYAWGDVDKDGDIDLVVVRKQPFTSTGKRVNVFFMNEGTDEGHAVNGVFVDRTDEYATDSDVSGDNGFNTPTNDRDVQLVDLNGDTWLDIVTATTLTDNQAKHLSHPRIYINKGEVGGVWQGWRYEDARIPQMHSTAGPRFCSVSAGDVTGDGAPDLYFGDYDSGGSQIFDFNNKLLINDGNGFFTDESNSRLTSEMRLAAFGAASIIADVNNDGVNDVIKQTSLNAPTHVAITYNNPSGEGFFNAYDTIYDLAPYFVAEGDLTGNGLIDLVVVDDGTDRILFNQGPVGAVPVSWNTVSLPSGPSGGFGGNAIIRDLNNDGRADIITTDVDVDIPGCSRSMQFYRNLGAGNVANDNPIALRTGTHDVAVMDINGDGWQDLFVGRCGTTEIWINNPPIGLVFTYPDGLPQFVDPGQPVEFDVQVSAFGGGTPAPGTGRFFYSLSGGPFTEQNMQDLGGDLYRATLPAADCPESIRFYVQAELQGGTIFTDPQSAPASTFTATAAEGIDVTLRDEIEGDVSQWSVVNAGGLTSGAWEQADPNGTISGGSLASPEDDATAGAENVMCFVTENGAPGGTAGAADVDGGPTDLISPRFDLDGTDGVVSYSRWMFCDDEGLSSADFLQVFVSNNDGASWTEVTAERTGGTGSAWESRSFAVSDWITTSAEMRVRFRTSDSPNDSVTEAGIDNFQIETIICGTVDPCTGDTDGNQVVDFTDLLTTLSSWGPCVGCPADFDGDGVVGFTDLLTVLSAWGPCP